MDAQGTQLETAIAKDEQHHELSIQIRLDRHEQCRQLRQGGQVWCVRLTTDAQAFGEERLEQKVVGAVDAQNRAGQGSVALNGCAVGAAAILFATCPVQKMTQEVFNKPDEAVAREAAAQAATSQAQNLANKSSYLTSLSAGSCGTSSCHCQADLAFLHPGWFHPTSCRADDDLRVPQWTGGVG